MQQFIDEVLSKFTEDITDQVFLFIQNDEKNLLQKYLDTIGKNDRQSVNSALGEQVKTYFNLKNMKSSTTKEILKGKPRSYLIKTEYTKHTK